MFRGLSLVLVSTVGAWALSPLAIRIVGVKKGRTAAQTAASWPSADCNVSAAKLPKNRSRVYIALRNGRDGSGRSLEDARDGSTVERFDGVLRCYSEGCSEQGGRSPVPKTEDLLVCIGPGTFQTEGQYDYLISVPHKSGRGFTLGKGWKVHGAGMDKTTVQLKTFLATTSPDPIRAYPVGTGANTVMATNSDGASGVEISDLTIDGNYPALKKEAQQRGTNELNVEAIHLRADEGGHWVHDLHVKDMAGEIGGRDIRFETFPVWVVSMRSNSGPNDSHLSTIEHITMADFHGGAGTAIAVANAPAEVRNNTVKGYAIGYGGWQMGPVWFHDNVTEETEYGFNIDSGANDGVRIESNQVNRAKKYGIVVGGGGVYKNFQIKNNKVSTADADGIGLVFQGNVTDAFVAGNVFASEAANGGGTAAKIWSNGKAGANSGNNYEGNQFGGNLKLVFRRPSKREQNCAHGNHDEKGAASRELPDTQGQPCAPGPSTSAPAKKSGG